MSNPRYPISDKGLRTLQDLWLEKFHGQHKFEGGNAQVWFQCVMEFLSSRGDEVIPHYMREQEERLINLGRSREYLAALADIVGKSPQHNDYDQTVLVLTATPEERAEALNKVLNT